jgi:multisubunit Na+/H+ antiporter MnhB subunit
MSADLIFSTAVALLVVGVAGYTILARESFPAIVAFVAYGLLVALIWMGLAAPDVALTEAALGGGVTGALLLGACSRLRGEKVRENFPRPIGRLVALVLCLCVTAGLIGVVLLLPEPAPTLAPIALEPLATTGLGNAVTAVLMAYRALDTMLEKVVLLLALVAVWSLAPDRFWGGRPAYGYASEKGGPLDLLARLLIPLGFLVGIYLFWVGADAPGGAFAGGALISAMGILSLLAGLGRAPRVGGFGLRLALAAGIAVFLLVGLGGFVWASDFLAYPDGFAKPVIVVIEIAMTLSVGVTLAMLVAGPPGTPGKGPSA